MNALLVGNPNVGKSALFSHMTGISVKTSNLAGTTVSFTQGKWQLPLSSCEGSCINCIYLKKCNNQDDKLSHKTIVDLIDAPGTYSLNPEAKSEQIAVDMIEKADIIINVIDATNLERNLSLTMDLAVYKKPMIIALNMWDETKHLGIKIDIYKLEKLLGVPVIPTNGRSGQGVSEIGKNIFRAKALKDIDYKEKWQIIGELSGNVQEFSHRHHTMRDYLQELSIHPIWGFPISLIVLAGLFSIVIFCGGYLNSLMKKLFTLLWIPLMDKLYAAINTDWLRTILIGDLIDGQIALETSMGVLTTGIFIPIGLVMPYLLFFYIALGFLEDWGYLPRMAIIFDSFFHRMGLHGYSVIPLMFSTGCNIPGVLCLRNLESRRERFITAAIACTTIPCMAQSAVIFAAVASFGSIYLILVITTLVTVAILLGAFLNMIVKGETPTLIVEIPPYRVPSFKMQAKKLLMSLKGFFAEAVPLMLLGIFLIQVLNLTGVLEGLFFVMKPLVTGLWGLPEETAAAMLVGIIRKDAAVALLAPLTLNSMQTVTAVITLVLYFPCVATYTVLAREMGIKDLLKITLIMIIAAVVGGIFMNLLGMVFVPWAIILIEIALCVLAIIIKKRNKQVIEEI